MAKIVVALVVPVAVFLAGCGAAQDPGSAAGGARPQPPARSQDPEPLYEADATVLDDGERGPMLCLGAVLASLPPQCGDVPIVNWDWEAVTGEERASGTVWGSYHVVGTYDGTDFTVTEAGPYEEASAEGEPDFASPCPEPDGGWSGAGLTQDDDEPAHAYARAQREYVTSWVTHLEPEKLEFSPVLVNVIFTADADRHRRELAKIWDGPLCVIERDVPSARELARIRTEVEAGLDELGLQMLWSSGPGVQPVIEIGVVADIDGHGQAAIDARYGPGLVRVVPALTPLRAA